MGYNVSSVFYIGPIAATLKKAIYRPILCASLLNKSENVCKQQHIIRRYITHITKTTLTLNTTLDVMTGQCSLSFKHDGGHLHNGCDRHPMQLTALQQISFPKTLISISLSFSASSFFRKKTCRNTALQRTSECDRDDLHCSIIKLKLHERCVSRTCFSL